MTAFSVVQQSALEEPVKDVKASPQRVLEKLGISYRYRERV
jgi:hypothetical protein